MRAIPNHSTYSPMQGMWFVFSLDEHKFSLWVSTFTGKEEAYVDSTLVLLCHKRSLAFTRRQHGHRGSVLSKAAAIRSRKVVMDDGTWRCVRWAAARLVMRG
jgi:hypothetical protein